VIFPDLSAQIFLLQYVPSCDKLSWLIAAEVFLSFSPRSPGGARARHGRLRPTPGAPSAEDARKAEPTKSWIGSLILETI